MHIFSPERIPAGRPGSQASELKKNLKLLWGICYVKFVKVFRPYMDEYDVFTKQINIPVERTKTYNEKKLKKYDYKLFKMFLC